jgi:hypothetical protein
MDYRNERDALRGRVERLEQELSDARRELAEARRREGEAAAEGSRAEAERLARLEAALPEAEALIQQLRRELSAVEAMRAEPATDDGSEEPAGQPDRARAASRISRADDLAVAAYIPLAAAAALVAWGALRYCAHSPPPQSIGSTAPPPRSAEPTGEVSVGESYTGKPEHALLDGGGR